MMPEVEAQTDKPRRQVGLISAHETFLGIFNRVECQGLTDEEAEAVKHELMSRNAWRLRFGSNAFCSELAPIVLAYRYKLPFPPPCPERFEPTPLNESEPALQALADRIREDADPGLYKTLDHKPKISHFAKLGLLTAGIVAIVASVLGIWQWSRSHSLLLAFTAILPMSGIVVNLVQLRMKRKGNWYLVPGGVVVREVAMREPTSLHVLSPRDTNLQIFGSQVTTYDRAGNKCFRTVCTPLEIAVLLAVWQSPIPAPDVSKLVDLQ